MPELTGRVGPSENVTHVGSAELRELRLTKLVIVPLVARPGLAALTNGERSQMTLRISI